MRKKPRGELLQGLSISLIVFIVLSPSLAAAPHSVDELFRLNVVRGELTSLAIALETAVASHFGQACFAGN